MVWSGALVPAYRQFFVELARFAGVRALGPLRWTHGSVPQTGAAGPAAPGCDLRPATFWPAGSSRYLVPSLPFHLWRYRPRYLYLMEEMDRPAFLWHALLAKLAWPPVRVVAYCLQNLARPRYYRRRHALALKLNCLLASRIIAATAEAAEVIRGHGWRGPLATVPLWASETLFTPLPATAVEREAARRELGIPPGAIVLVFAGSLVEAKGLLLLKEVLPRFPGLRLLAAGRGPLEEVLREALGPQWIHAGALPGEALARLYRLGDYVILPSITTDSWKEQVGRALVEGILCGCIALGSDSGHIPELTCAPGATFRQGDAESLASLLATLPLRDAERIRATQRRKVEEAYTSRAAARLTWEFLSDGTGKGEAA